MTEKRKRTYPLEEIKNLIRQSKYENPGVNVIRGATSMGFSVYEAHQEILNLEQKHFRKSMTENFNNKVWLDVYKKEIKGVLVYVKFKKLKDQFLLTSFKPDKD